jgi:hypothetical protein
MENCIGVGPASVVAGWVEGAEGCDCVCVAGMDFLSEGEPFPRNDQHYNSEGKLQAVMSKDQLQIPIFNCNVPIFRGRQA